MHYLEKIIKIEFKSFKVKEDTKALSKMAKVVSGFQSMVTSHRARSKWVVLVKTHRTPTKLVASNPVSGFGLCRK